VYEDETFLHALVIRDVAASSVLDNSDSKSDAGSEQRLFGFLRPDVVRDAGRGQSKCTGMSAVPAWHGNNRIVPVGECLDRIVADTCGRWNPPAVVVSPAGVRHVSALVKGAGV
jgi:uncharacterized membrane protein